MLFKPKPENEKKYQILLSIFFYTLLRLQPSTKSDFIFQNCNCGASDLTDDRAY